MRSLELAISEVTDWTKVETLSKFAVILAAAGRSERFGNQYTKKVFTLLANRPMWIYSAEAFSKRDDVADHFGDRSRRS